ncbi:MAG: iron-containing alcohol dehydrogenase [Pirellulaceae bacterium]
MKHSTISYLCNVQYGPGSREDLPELLSQLNITRPLLVTDEGVIAAGIPEQLPGSASAVFSGIQSNPSEASVLAGLDVFRAHDCDGIIALGGGSPIDCAKCISLLATHEGTLESFAFAHGGNEKITANKPPLIAIPTTAGTGTEVGRAGLVTMSSGSKLAIVSAHLYPNWSICDAELTLGLPPGLTAATGMDAISHCIETYCSPRYNPVADAIAIDGLVRAVNNIRTAYHDGSNLEARCEMMMSATQGALSFAKGLGAVHAVSHPLGALEDRRLHHGTLNAVLMPHVIRFNVESIESRIDDMTNALGLSSGADSFCTFLNRLLDDLDLPPSLGDMGVIDSDLSHIPQAALIDHCAATNPRQMTLDNTAQLLRDAL